MNATEQQAWNRLGGVPKLSHMFPHPLSIKGVGFSSDLLRMFALVPNSEGKYIRCRMCGHLEGMFVCNTVTERVVFFHVPRFHAVLWRSLNWPDDAVPKMYSQWVRRVYFECPPGPNQRITIFDSASQSEDEKSDSSSSIQQPRLPSIECQTQSFWLFLVLLLFWKMTPVMFSFSLFYCEVLLKTKLEMYLVRVFKH